MNQLNDPADQATAVGAMISTLDGHLAHLREIKQLEMAWVDRFSVLILPAIAYFAASDPNKNDFSQYQLAWTIFAYFILTVCIQNVLLNERRSYYRVLRSVVRAQNYLGLFRLNFLSKALAGAAFPKGLGPNQDRNGTQPFRTFLYRQSYTFALFLILVLVAIYQNVAMTKYSLLVVFDLLWLVNIYWRDYRDLRSSTVSRA